MLARCARSPAPAVLGWLHQQASAELYTMAIMVAEIRYGIARLPQSHRKNDLVRTANEVFAALPDQVLPFDLKAAAPYADAG